MADWTRDEDGKPGAQLLRTQPELTSKGWVWTQRIVIDWPTPSHTLIYIRDDGGQYLFDHGKVFPLRQTEDDAA